MAIARIDKKTTQDVLHDTFIKRRNCFFKFETLQKTPWTHAKIRRRISVNNLGTLCL